MKINPRPAEMGDYGAFISMWEDFLKERELAGSVLVCSESILEYATDLFYRIVLNRIQGVALIVPQKAVCLWGPELAFPTRAGRTLIAQGTWVRPAYREHGVGMGLFRAALAHAREQGFDAVLSSVDAGNDLSQAIASKVGFMDAQVSKLLPTDAEV